MLTTMRKKQYKIEIEKKIEIEQKQKRNRVHRNKNRIEYIEIKTNRIETEKK